MDNSPVVAVTRITKVPEAFLSRFALSVVEKLTSVGFVVPIDAVQELPGCVPTEALLTVTPLGIEMVTHSMLRPFGVTVRVTSVANPVVRVVGVAVIPQGVPALLGAADRMPASPSRTTDMLARIGRRAAIRRPGGPER